LGNILSTLTGYLLIRYARCNAVESKDSAPLYLYFNADSVIGGKPFLWSNAQFDPPSVESSWHCSVKTTHYKCN